MLSERGGNFVVEYFNNSCVEDREAEARLKLWLVKEWYSLILARMGDYLVIFGSDDVLGLPVFRHRDGMILVLSQSIMGRVPCMMLVFSGTVVFSRRAPRPSCECQASISGLLFSYPVKKYKFYFESVGPWIRKEMWIMLSNVNYKFFVKKLLVMKI